MRQRISDDSRRRPFLKTVGAALEEHPLPPFKVWSRYLAPGGSLLTSDESGLHFVDFTLKRD
jgi:hypothetical protein